MTGGDAVAPTRHAVVVDLGFGDAGKGSVVDWLCAHHPVRTVVRFNGGAQAAHNVVTPDGRHHTFAQFGAGTFVPGVGTHLSRFMMVDPLALVAEAGHLSALGVGDALDRLTVDRDALLTTPYHRAANRERERARGARRHGSCGVGIGETAAYALRDPAAAPRVGDCLSPAILRRKLVRLRDHLADDLGGLHRLGGDLPGVGACVEAFRAFGCRVRIVTGPYLNGLLREGMAVFEGAQGVLLDERYGFHPYTTWSKTTFANADTLLAEAGAQATRIGVIRSYLTRHGPGPFATEDPALTATLTDRHNRTGEWQGPVRVGHLDAVALRYALDVAGDVDALALTHLDIAEARDDLRICHEYDLDGARVTTLRPGKDLTSRMLRARPVYGPLTDPVAQVEAASGVPVLITSYGPNRSQKRPRLASRPPDGKISIRTRMYAEACRSGSSG